MHNHNPAHTHTQGHLLLDLAFLVPPGPLSLPLDQTNPSTEMNKELSSAFSEQDQPHHSHASNDLGTRPGMKHFQSNCTQYGDTYYVHTSGPGCPCDPRMPSGPGSPVGPGGPMRPYDQERND